MLVVPAVVLLALAGVLLDVLVGKVVGTVAAGVLVLVLAAAATWLVRAEMTSSGGCRTHPVVWVFCVHPVRVCPRGGAGRKAMVTSQLFRSSVPELQSGLHVLSGPFLYCCTPSAAGSCGEDHVIT